MQHCCELGATRLLIAMTNPTINYKVVIVKLSEEDGGGYMAYFPILKRACVGYGVTRSEALEDLEESLPVFMESMEINSEPLPEEEPTTL